MSEQQIVIFPSWEDIEIKDGKILETVNAERISIVYYRIQLDEQLKPKKILNQYVLRDKSEDFLKTVPSWILKYFLERRQENE